MTRLIAKLKANPAAYKLQIAGTLALPYAERHLPRGEVLRDGDLATASDGRIYRVQAQPEALLHVECAEPKAAAVVGYLLGNGHVAVEIGTGFVRAAYDAHLESMMRALDLPLTRLEAAFEPNLGHSASESEHHHRHGHEHDHDH
jgi:urease accessory protein